jgi:hypothetical protein
MLNDRSGGGLFRTYWTYAAMLLLGVSLTVGFYEGRRLVKNTAKALTAASSITASASRRERRQERSEDEEVEDGEPEATAHDGDGNGERGERKRRRNRNHPPGVELPEGPAARVDKMDMLRSRQRARLTGSRTGTVPLAEVHPEAIRRPAPVEEEPLDTAAEP